ncbi:MAG: hypothetical protein LBJ35_04920 [Spirochaetaceae bacterium]|nr:hypothetical protein [Spirochaetaceae bacterium]
MKYNFSMSAEQIRRARRRFGIFHNMNTPSKKKIIRITLIVCAVFFIIAGIARGDASALWRKAVFICMECIGIA